MVVMISTQLNEACDQDQTVETCCAKEKNKILRKEFVWLFVFDCLC